MRLVWEVVIPASSAFEKQYAVEVDKVDKTTERL